MFRQKNKENDDFASKDIINTKSSQNHIRTLISEGCKFEGNLFSPAYTKIDGIVKGNLTGESGLIIGTKGHIEGDVKSIEVVVYGNVNGNIKANKLEIKRGGKLIGNISTDSLSIEEGALFIGKCEMVEIKNNKKEVFELPSSDDSSK